MGREGKLGVRRAGGINGEGGKVVSGGERVCERVCVRECV